MTTIAEADTRTHVQNIWTEALGIPVVPAPCVDIGGCEGFVTGSVAIDGDWRGLIVLQCHEAAAWAAMRAMHAIDTDGATTEQLHDVVAELANMTCGGIKALLPGRCTIALPVVADGCAVVDPQRYALAQEHGFLCGGNPVFVRVYEAVQ